MTSSFNKVTNIFMPIDLPHHWVGTIIRISNDDIIYYDPYHNRMQTFITKLLMWLEEVLACII